MPEPESSSPPKNADASLPRLVIVLRKIDRWSLYIVAIITLAIAQFRYGWLIGFPIGCVVTLGIWWILRLLIVMIIHLSCRKVLNDQVTREVIRVINRAWADEDYQRAVEDMRGIISLHGEGFQTMLALAGMLLESDNPEEALIAVDKALEFAPESEELVPQRGLVIKAEILRKLGRLGEAAALIESLMEQGWRMMETHLTHAKLLADMGETDEADNQLSLARQRRLRFPLSLFISRALKRKWREEIVEAERHVAARRAAIPPAL